MTVDLASLNDVTDLSVYEHGYMDNGNTFQNYLATVRSAYNNGEKYGWYVRLSNGERSLVKPTIVGGIVLFPTFKPTEDICGYGGDSYLYALYYETGTAYEESVIGLGTDTISADGDIYSEVLKKLALGGGISTSVAIHAGREEGLTNLIQLGSGMIKQLQMIPASSLRSRTTFWRQVR